MRAIETLINSGRLEEARKILEETKSKEGETYETLFVEAKILFQEQRFLEALKSLERCLRQQPRDPEVYKLVAFSAIRADRVDIAESALKSAMELAPNDYLTHFHLGALYYTGSHFLQAEPELQAAVRLNPEHMPALLFLGLTQEEIGPEATAIETYHKAIEITSERHLADELPHLYLGRLLYRLNRLDEAQPFLEEAITRNPRSAEGLCLLAKMYITQERQADALPLLTRSITVDPSYPEPHYLLSRVYVKEGRNSEAQRELKAFEELKKSEKFKYDPRGLQP
jgi:protein O-GlcNAc transferase